jgi:hypothetical protein
MEGKTAKGEASFSFAAKGISNESPCILPPSRPPTEPVGFGSRDAAGAGGGIRSSERRGWSMIPRRLLVWGLCAAASLLLFSSSGALAVTEDFGGHAKGTVVAGELPGGGEADSSTFFNDFDLSVQNNGGGPRSCLIFDSNNPGPLDLDLGTPNETCPGGGPGIGIGGQVGQPGENCVPMDNLLVVAENIVDGGGDGFVDEPNDEGGGGMIRFLFHAPTVLLWITLIDIETEPARETGMIELYDGTSLVGQIPIVGLGNNCALTIDFENYADPVTRMDVIFSGSGGIGEIEYRPSTTATEPSSWGQIKRNFR